MTRARDVANLDGLLTTTGDTYYASSAATPARLGIGSTGDVLTVSGGVPTWAAPVSGSLTSLATGTVSSTSVVLSSINQNYKHLYLILTSPQLSAANEFRWILNGDSASNYSTTRITVGATTLSSAATTAGLVPANANMVATANAHSWTIFIENYALAKSKSITMSATRNDTLTGSYYSWGTYQSSTAITSITMTTAAGTSTFSVGTYTLYGVS